MGTGPRVLFVSKPIAPPWHDGSKNLVRDVASHLVDARATVLSVAPAPACLGPGVQTEPLYADAGGFAPGVRANARVLRRLLTGDPHDLWAFVFAPNGASSSAAAFAIRARRLSGWRGRVVQIVPSAPRDFRAASRLLFGDHVVVMSDWTHGRFLGSGARGRDLRVIPPCAAAPPRPPPERVAAIRSQLALGAGPTVLYPGDYETSFGAQTVARAIPHVLRRFPDARFVFACRPKTRRAVGARAVVEEALERAGLTLFTRHVGEVDDMAALVAASTVVAAPIDDLYGKVDLPMVLLEALALGIPMVLARGGPLEAIPSARFVGPRDELALAAALTTILGEPAVSDAMARDGKALHASRFAPNVVAAQYDQLFREAWASSLPGPSTRDKRA